MVKISIQVKGHQEDIATVWVHFQEMDRQATVPYRIWVPDMHFHQVFDPYATKAASQTRVEYLNDTIREFGTFIVEGYVENMVQVLGESRKPYQWVIVSVDDIRENESGIELMGKAVRFDQTQYQ
ncbi:MAG: hypothetical protein WBV94_24240 [Blastocatellia bacterium]